MLTKEAYKKLNQNKDGIRFIRPFSEYTLQEVIDALTEFEKLKELYNKQSKLLNLYRNLSMETDVIERSKYWEQINKIELEKMK